jgi:hypothetical protein
MTSEERWKVVNEVPVADLMAGFRALAEMMEAGATREELDAARKAMVKAWATQQGVEKGS